MDGNEDTAADPRPGAASGASAAWDPVRYLRFAGERARPFAELVARTYVHVLSGADPLLGWVASTQLRPVPAQLGEADGAEVHRRVRRRPAGGLSTASRRHHVAALPADLRRRFPSVLTRPQVRVPFTAARHVQVTTSVAPTAGCPA